MAKYTPASVGTLSTNTVMDMSRGSEYVQGFRTLIGEKRDAVASASVGLLELARTTETQMKQAFHGYSPVAAIANADKRVVCRDTNLSSRYDGALVRRRVSCGSREGFVGDRAKDQCIASTKAFVSKYSGVWEQYS